MRKLLLAKVAFQWNEECKREFIGLKEILTSPLFLMPLRSQPRDHLHRGHFKSRGDGVSSVAGRQGGEDKSSSVQVRSSQEELEDAQPHRVRSCGDMLGSPES